MACGEDALVEAEGPVEGFKRWAMASLVGAPSVKITSNSRVTGC